MVIHQNQAQPPSDDEMEVHTHEVGDEIVLNEDYQSPPSKTLTKQTAGMQMQTLSKLPPLSK